MPVPERYSLLLSTTLLGAEGKGSVTVCTQDQTLPGTLGSNMNATNLGAKDEGPLSLHAKDSFCG